ncbi:MAG: hypothetical protein VXY45_04150, partial [Pseudomonadota bacterium]|nr:hypothetical protein [Pseudomonadota bacterium]
MTPLRGRHIAARDSIRRACYAIFLDQPTTPADDPAEQTPAPPAGANETSDRFRAKRDRILDAAAQII